MYSTSAPHLNLDFQEWTIERYYREMVVAEVGILGDLLQFLEGGYAKTEYFIDVAPTLLPREWVTRQMNRLEYVFLSETNVDVTKAIENWVCFISVETHPSEFSRTALLSAV